MRNILLIIFLLPFSAMAQEMEMIQYEKDNYSIAYPENWTLKDFNTMGAVFLLHPENVDKAFVENINLTIQVLNENMDLENYIGMVEKQIAGMLTNHEILVSDFKSDKGLDYHVFIVEGSANNMQLKSMIYTWLIKNLVYALTFVSSLEDYEQNHLVAKNILDSFTIRPN